MNPVFWQGKRVLLTGHTGFKGSWLSLWLQLVEAKVCGYALTPQTTPNLFDLASVTEQIQSEVGDIRDADRLQQVVAEFQPEIVIHMAAQPLVLDSYERPVETYETNVMGTVHLLEAVRTVDSVRSVVVVTSDKCYENREWVWGYREDEAMGGHDPYSSSKGCAELITSAYSRSFFPIERYDQHHVAIATGRAGNVIGGGDWAANRLIPDVVRAITEGQPPQLRNPLATRPWQHVLEPLHGYLVLAEALYVEGAARTGGWNFGPHAASVQPVGNVVAQLLKLWDDKLQWIQDPVGYPHEAHSLNLDWSKARIELGWQPKLDLDTTLSWIVDWTRAWHDQQDMRVVTQAQIEQYMRITT